ncbi:hypothetical protein SAMN04489859_1008130 [Paracoccus alcaliphilus]|uniref:Tail fiber protein n=1 Tax=Paracoccus alcaliphilus TaxID=34002 RepID=A0A1H8H5Q6_9RHOB|nr:hypothetical protein [Paracoccus alcaliphilus]SEN51465.1 hypothetical protein SAMN04489859_1008130 [Paracoccus alcaliphilus]
MPRVSGQYTLPPGYFAVSGEIIQPSQHNPPLEDIAQALTDSLPRDGSAGMSGNLPMGGNRITGLAAATAAGHAPRYDQVVPVTGGTMSGPLRVPEGSDGTPGLQFGSSDDGINWVAGQAVRFVAGGTLMARLNVGTALSTALDIVTRGSGDGRYMQQSWTLTAGAGLTGGGSGAANRTLAVDGTVVRTSRQINTGTGLTGGGNLGSNRTLSIDFNPLPLASGTMTLPRLIAMDGSSHVRLAEGPLKANFNLAGSGTTITAGAGLTGGGTLENNRTLSIDAATVNEAQAGAVNNKVMTPLRVAQATMGVLQSWASPSRSVNTVYQNTTGRPIQVSISAHNCLYQVSTTGTGSWITVGESSGNIDGWQSPCFIVPNGHYYRANLKGGGVNINHWAELR